jgi:Domain of unknown function (DUF4145)
MSITTDELGRQRATPSQQIASSTVESGTQCPLTVSLHWMLCQNHECRQVIVLVTRSQTRAAPGSNRHGVDDMQTWFAVPKIKHPPNLDPLVTNPLRKDYIEAHTILDDSPRMSSVLSRRILADLLKQYASLDQFNLEAPIDAFVNDTKHPRRIRENLHYLREMGNFGAHTQEQVASTAVTAVAPQPAPDPVIIEVDKSEAEWSLKVVADLFDYFIVAPAKDAELRKAFDKKIEDANRKPIKPLTA